MPLPGVPLFLKALHDLWAIFLQLESALKVLFYTMERNTFSSLNLELKHPRFQFKLHLTLSTWQSHQDTQRQSNKVGLL